MTARDFPGLVCDACGETPLLKHEGDTWAPSTTPFYVVCACGEHGPHRSPAAAAVVAWEAGQRYGTSTRKTRDAARVLAGEQR